MTGRRISMTDDELVAVVRRAVRDELSDAGLRLDDSTHQDEAREDFRFLRKMRQSTYGMASKIGLAVILAMLSGIGWLIYQGFKVFVRQG